MKKVILIDEKELENLKNNVRASAYQQGRKDAINAIKNDFSNQLTEEMCKPYREDNLCKGLFLCIKRCDWYLDDSKEQKE